MGICASEQKSGYSSDISYCAAEYRVKDNPGNLQLIWVTIAAAAYCILYSHIVHGKNLINIYWALLAWFSVLIRNKINQRDRPNSTASFLRPNALCALLNSLDYFILIPSPPSNRFGGIRKLLYFWIRCQGWAVPWKRAMLSPDPCLAHIFLSPMFLSYRN